MWTGQVQGLPVITGAGGPDVYGYTWLDSDTAGGPIYSWIDTTAAWTKLTGLFDDNVVGPVPIGFTFPYYWYETDHIFVGSNGYVSFSDRTLEASAFQPVPDPQRPNDVLAILMDDLDFTTGTPSCKYWTNAAADTFIISYINVRFWNSPASTNTFQIILSKADSTITFQYKTQTGPSQSSDSRSVGIEQITGTDGLRYLFGYTPPANVIHASLTVVFTPPATTSFQIMDVALTEAGTADSRGFIMLPSQSRSLWAKVQNTGNQVATSVDVYGYVMDTLGTVYFGDTVNIATMNPGQVDSVAFTPDWTPSAEKTYFLKAKAFVTGDGVVLNDSSLAEILVMSYPGDVVWVDGFTEEGMSWNGTGSGWANKFTPPEYPCLVQSVSALVETTNAPPKNIKVQLRDDDTPDGSPGTVLAETTLSVTGAARAWYTYNLPAKHPFVFEDGSFFVGYIQLETSDPFLAMDFSQPKSRQGWEYTGSWAPHRDNDSMDVGLKAHIGTYSGPTLWQVYASDGPTSGPGIDDDDYVILNFNVKTNTPAINAGNIDAVLNLDPSHTWLSGDASLTGAVWSSDSMQLVVYLTTSGGAPTVAVGDTVTPDNFTIQDKYAHPCGTPCIITGSFEVGVQEGVAAKRHLVSMLCPASPNPFTSGTRISYEVAVRGHVGVHVYDATGRVVADLVNEVKDPGMYTIAWDGRGNNGSRLSSGVYFYRMEAGTFTTSKKVTLLR
jgi:hypothetical protein